MAMLTNSYFSIFNNNSGSNNIFSGFSLTDYNSIRSGAYKKLMNSYYGKTNSKSTEAVSKIVNNADSMKLTSTKNAADKLSDAAKVLYTNGTDSAFKDEKNENAIIDAVNTFVEEYNNTIDAVDSTNSSKVLKAGVSLAKQTNAYSTSLAKVGITVNYDNTLSVDKDLLANAASSDLKSLFSGVGSFAYQTAAKADQIGLAAKQQSSGTSLYGSNGNLNYMNMYSSIDAYL